MADQLLQDLLLSLNSLKLKSKCISENLVKYFTTQTPLKFSVYVLVTVHVIHKFSMALGQIENF